ncbi:twin-arginine translocase TatA/TatE family subunit, partial [Staphylococcus capitis]|uniref:twin-arginine translocase TatA/TatE family subunit n=1 Tax=Staphylococcus capitis TaxID=29388 RepID=UPI0011A78286
MFENMFVVGMTGGRSLVVMGIMGLIIFPPTKLPQFPTAVRSTLKQFKSPPQHIHQHSHHTPTKPSKSHPQQSKYFFTITPFSTLTSHPCHCIHPTYPFTLLTLYFITLL